MSAPAFTPLRVRSHGSLLCGTASPDALIGRALALGYETLALTDRDNLYLAVAFYRAARPEGLAPILGAEITARDRPRPAIAHARDAAARPGGASGTHALALVIDRRGYANLCAVLTARHLDPEFDLVTSLAEHAAGLHLVVESPALAAGLLRAGVPAACGVFDAARPRAAAAGRDGGVWIGVRGLAAERTMLAERVAQARQLGVPLVATGDCALLHATDHEAHRVAVTAAAGELLERMPPSAFCAREAWLAPPAEWTRRVRAACAGAGVPEAALEALANNAALAQRCRLDLEMGTPIFPRAPLPDGVDGATHLMRLGVEGVRRRYRGDDPAALARLRDELAMIERLGFTDYFVLVAEIVGFARAHGIPTVGRGSGAGSIVAYALGITNVDPLRYGLYFERFLHPSRRDCPDLDIDLCWKRRDEVIRHVYDTYGHDRVAMISTHATLGARSAFRETAKALGVPNDRVNALAKRIPRELPKPYLEHLAASPEGRAVDWREPPLADALRLAEALDGAPRHLSIHAGGLVIADRAITHYVPLQRAAKDVVVTQFEMRAIEAIGLVKMDLLGNRALTEIGDCVTLVERRHGTRIDVERLPHDDPATLARLVEGDTLNCFQLESPAMRHLLRMLRPANLDDVIAAVALIRPGAAESGMKEVFARRHRGLEPATFLHPRLERVLGPTHGILLYEEDVMTVAAALTGLSLAEGDDLRRAIGSARSDEEFRWLESGFVTQAVNTGVERESARAAWRELTRFAAYAFCKAHAAGYGTLGWHGAYLKTHHPTEYAVGVLNHHAGMYATWVHVEDLRRSGVEFRAPCTQRSAWDATLELDAGGAAAVRVGLSRVFGLAEATAARIVRERPCAGLAGFIDAVRPSLPELEALVLAGALDWTGRTRPSLVLEARVTTSAKRPTTAATAAARRVPMLVGAGGDALAPAPVAPVAIPEIAEFDLARRVRGELQSSGLWFSAHPLDVLVARAEIAGATPAAALSRLEGRRATVVGMPCAYRRVETKSGGTMLFMTLADQTGLAECVLFPDAYRALAPALHGEIIRAEGRVEGTMGALTLTVARAGVVTGRAS